MIRVRIGCACIACEGVNQLGGVRSEQIMERRRFFSGVSIRFIQAGGDRIPFLVPTH